MQKPENDELLTEHWYRRRYRNLIVDRMVEHMDNDPIKIRWHRFKKGRSCLINLVKRSEVTSKMDWGKSMNAVNMVINWNVGH